ncbi:MAG: ribonuclease domain-containing protein [Lachnospiraceae bacterium]
MRMKKWTTKLSMWIALLLLSVSILTGCGEVPEQVMTDSRPVPEQTAADPQPTVEVEEDGVYTSKEEVAAYLYRFGHLPSNYITKKEARDLGWISSEGNLDEVAPGMSIGGDYFGNYEGILPEDREYHECDIDSDGGYRGAKRIVYSDDRLIYYTEDHYESFELLYGEE